MSPGSRRVGGLIGILAASGVLHFVVPKPYRKIVPPQLGDPDLLVRVSGLAELGCAALLAVPTTRRLGGLASAALFIAVFPANVYAVSIFEGPLPKAAGIARLPLQIPLVRVALQVARES